MQKINKYFLEALKASLNGETVDWITEDISFEGKRKILLHYS